jgi:hypothetical protein
MRDVFVFKLPLVWLGKLANVLFSTRYMTDLLTKRSLVIKEVAEKG